MGLYSVYTVLGSSPRALTRASAPSFVRLISCRTLLRSHDASISRYFTSFELLMFVSLKKKILINK